MKKTWRVLLVGFGTVGQGVAERLRDGATELAAVGLDAQIVGVIDPALGSIASQDGLDPGQLLDLMARYGSLRDYPDAEPAGSGVEAIDTIDADVVFEMTPTNLVDGSPGLDHVRAALAAGRHVATTNKGPVALAWAELSELARVNDVQLRCEGTVMSGTPLLNVCEGGLAGAGVYSVRGILNGTCNFVLCRMEDGIDYDEALAEAQQLGYAETDPSADVDGWDAAAKVAILGNIVLGGGLTLSDVSREGIVGIDRSDVDCAAQQGNRLRLVGSVRVVDGTVVDPKVAVAELPFDDPLAQVRGPGNLLTFETQALGPVSIAGPGAGRAATGHALIADLVAIQRRLGS